jgi:hypothetical protein
VKADRPDAPSRGQDEVSEGKAERHIRLLAPLAFLSPRIVSALLDGAVPADLTLAQLAAGLPYSWIECADARHSSADASHSICALGNALLVWRFVGERRG